jgi:hypothetical protein
MKTPAMLFAVALLTAAVSSCASQTTIITFPRACQVRIDGKTYGTSPAKVLLPNRTFGDYTITLHDEGGTEVFRDKLPLDFVVWGIFWPPLGFLYNLFGAAPCYEIDTSVAAARGVGGGVKPSDERDQPPAKSRFPEVDSWTNLGFELLDRGWLSQARFYFELGHRVDPKCREPILGLAIYHRQKGDTAKAQEWVRRYLEANQPAAAVSTASP